MNVSLKALIGKLNDTCRNGLDAAAGLCLSRTHYDVDIEHLFLKLTEMPDTDLQHILRHYEIDASRLSRDLTRALDRLKTGNARTPALSPRIPRLITDGWTFASISFGAPAVRSGHLLLALLADDEMAALARESAPDLRKISFEDLHKQLVDVTSGSAEARSVGPSLAPEAEGGARLSPGSKTPALDQFTIDLTGRARQGDIDPVLGRDFEIRQMIDILTRRRQNNPILTGEAGVGKTAVVEGSRCASSPATCRRRCRTSRCARSTSGLLQAGAGVKGEFENRLKSVIDEVKASPQPIILFIDEAHTLIGAGGAAGQNDAANLLKPALARGELRTIAATTWAEYKKYFEKDPALTRRFQVVKVEEPAEPLAIGDDARPGAARSRSITRSASSTRRSRPPCACRTATSPAASCPTRRSACSTPPARVWPSARRRRPPASRTASAASTRSTREIGILERESAHRHRLTRAHGASSTREKAEVEARLGRPASGMGRGARLVGELTSIREQAGGPWQPQQPRTATEDEPPAERRRRRAAARREMKRLNAELARVAGRDAAGAALRRRPGGGGGGRPAGPASRWARCCSDEIKTVLDAEGDRSASA